MQQFTQIEGERGASKIQNKTSEIKSEYIANSLKQQLIANANRVPPRKVHTTNVSKLKSRLFAFNQRKCALSIGTVVGSFRYICSWAKLLGITFSISLILWSIYCISIIGNNINNQFDDLFFYTNSFCLFSSILCLSASIISIISNNFKIYSVGNLDGTISNTGRIWALTSLKSLSTLYFLESLLIVFPISLSQIDNSHYLTTISSVIIFSHLAPSILFYFAYLRGEDFKIDERHIPISI
ncbi:hypothetical protein FG386_003657 [Cryptosporidium ryanae]|uniref:uncharacterized protein n=1 Tax=Cryptosporidium ryanae TaxID=515981 RepID=UPI00351A10E0|nr:hypothetical protein FG386_003657 [Cryptosporidium ryanae]